MRKCQSLQKKTRKNQNTIEDTEFRGRKTIMEGVDIKRSFEFQIVFQAVK